MERYCSAKTCIAALLEKLASSITVYLADKYLLFSINPDPGSELVFPILNDKKFDKFYVKKYIYPTKV